MLEEGHYRLSPHVRVYSDRDEFEARYRHACRLEEDQRMPEAVAEYRRAIELYGGDFLIEDLYEDWTMIERERLASMHLDILERLASYYTHNGQYHECIETCYRILEKDPCQESGHRLLMECYACFGLRPKALRQYELCEKILRLTYDIAPSLETKALRENL